MCPVWSAAQSTSQEGMSNLCLCKPGGKVETLFLFLVLQMWVHSSHWLSWFSMLGLICLICESIRWVSMWHILWWQRISHVSCKVYLVTNQHPPLEPFYILSLGLLQLPSALSALIIECCCLLRPLEGRHAPVEELEQTGRGGGEGGRSSRSPSQERHKITSLTSTTVIKLYLMLNCSFRRQPGAPQWKQ